MSAQVAQIVQVYGWYFYTRHFDPPERLCEVGAERARLAGKLVPPKKEASGQEGALTEHLRSELIVKVLKELDGADPWSGAQFWTEFSCPEEPLSLEGYFLLTTEGEGRVFQLSGAPDAQYAQFLVENRRDEGTQPGNGSDERTRLVEDNAGLEAKTVAKNPPVSPKPRSGRRGGKPKK